MLSHGETYLDNKNDVIWWAKGGVLKGQSPARLAFLKKVLDDAPPEGIELLDKMAKSRSMAVNQENITSFILANRLMKSWKFMLPKPPNGGGVVLTNGMQFTAEVLDTWNMAVTPVPGIFTVEKNGLFL